MEIFGVGPMELILILIVALMVFGPDKLPQIGAKLGRAMRDMRRATRAISAEINSTREAVETPARELAEPFQEVAGAAKTVSTAVAAARHPGEALRESVLRELNTPPATAPDSTEEHTIAPPPTVTTPEVPPAVSTPPEELQAALPTLEDPAAPSAPETFAPGDGSVQPDDAAGAPPPRAFAPPEQ